MSVCAACVCTCARLCLLLNACSCVHNVNVRRDTCCTLLEFRCSNMGCVHSQKQPFLRVLLVNNWICVLHSDVLQIYLSVTFSSFTITLSPFLCAGNKKPTQQLCQRHSGGKELHVQQFMFTPMESYCGCFTFSFLKV